MLRNFIDFPAVRLRSGRHFRLKARKQRIDGHRAQVLPAPGAHRYRARLHFLVPHDQLVRQLLQAVLADLVADLLVAQVGCHPDARAPKAPSPGSISNLTPERSSASISARSALSQLSSVPMRFAGRVAIL